MISTIDDLINFDNAAQEQREERKTEEDKENEKKRKIEDINVTENDKTNINSVQTRKKRKKNFICHFQLDDGLVCQKVFTRNWSLAMHMRIHTAQKPFKCIDCEKTFTQKGNLMLHTRVHTHEKPYECIKCKKTFSQKQTLAEHERRHIQHKPFKCIKCGNAFAGNSDLSKHMRIHNLVKPYCCDICKAVFTQNGALKVHMRLHTHEKPYKCPQCNEKFTQSSRIKAHMCRVHTGEKPFSCLDPNCDMKFVTRSNAKIHYQSMHSDEAAMKRKRKEQRLATAFQKAEIGFERNPWISFNCDADTGKKGAWLDLVVYKQNHIFIIECDERQHDTKHGNPFGYTLSCEIARMCRVQEFLMLTATKSGSIPQIVWIRYNPDAFFVDDVRKSTKITQKIREAKLVNVLNTFIPTQPVTVLYMYYDCKTVDGKLRPSIMQDEDFNESFAQFVIDPIVE